MDSASSMKIRRNSTSGMNNSSSRMKIALDSASQVAKSRTLQVKTRISESSGDSVSWTGQDLEIGGLGESWADSVSRVANGRTLSI